MKKTKNMSGFTFYSILTIVFALASLLFGIIGSFFDIAPTISFILVLVQQIWAILSIITLVIAIKKKKECSLKRGALLFFINVLILNIHTVIIMSTGGNISLFWDSPMSYFITYLVWAIWLIIIITNIFYFKNLTKK
jgi:hypothetical protein